MIKYFALILVFTFAVLGPLSALGSKENSNPVILDYQFVALKEL